MSYEFYKVLHIVGILMIFSGLVGILGLKLAGPNMPAAPRRLFVITHGVGLLIVLVAGFGLAARLGYFHNMPNWIWAKLGVWLILGGLLTAAKRANLKGWLMLALFWIFGGLAAWLAIVKPF